MGAGFNPLAGGGGWGMSQQMGRGGYGYGGYGYPYGGYYDGYDDGYGYARGGGGRAPARPALQASKLHVDVHSASGLRDASWSGMDPEFHVALFHRGRPVARLASARAAGGGTSPVWSGRGSRLTFMVSEALAAHELQFEVSIVSPNVVSSPTLVGQTGAIDVLHKADGNPRDFVISTGGTATVTATFIPLTDARAASASAAPKLPVATARPADPSAPWGEPGGGGDYYPDGASAANPF